MIGNCRPSVDDNSMSEVPQGEFNLVEFLWREAGRVSRLPSGDQAAWIEQLAEPYRGEPGHDSLLESLERLVDSASEFGEEKARLAHEDEICEADLCRTLEGLLDGSLSLPASRAERTRKVALLAIMGHRLPNLRSRLMSPDAQRFLEGQIDDFI